MLESRKYLLVAAGLFAFSCGVCAQNQSTDSGKSAFAPVSDTALPTFSPSPKTVSVDNDVQLIQAINKSVSGAEKLNKQATNANKAQSPIKSANEPSVSSKAPVSALPSRADKIAAPASPDVKGSKEVLSAPTAAVGLAPTTPVKHAAPALTAAKSNDNKTQIELELNKKVSYKIFSLNKPERLVVDIKDNSFSAEFDKAAFVNSPIKDIRTANRPDGIFRVVFDLKEPITFQHSEQESLVGSDSMKLVVELLPVDGKK